MIKKRKGFTMLELMVVLGILAVLLSVMGTPTNWAMTFGSDSADEQTASALSGLVSQYKLHHQEYPASLDDITKKKGIYDPYIDHIPTDSRGNPFNYASRTNSFSIWSSGENGTNDSGDGKNLSGDDIGIISF